MTQNFNFDVNIEKRMPDTGKVFMVDRMTSDYAMINPFDVDGFIEQVFQKYEQMAQDDSRYFGSVVRSREQLRRLWNLVMQMPEHGDKSLYPNLHGQQPALMEVWHKAGDYWRRGLRQGDILPAIVPSCKITRLDESEWIALFPKDMAMLDHHAQNTELTDVATAAAAAEVEDTKEFFLKCNSFGGASADAPISTTPSPVEQDLFAQMQQELDQLRTQNEALRMKNEELSNMSQPCQRPRRTRRQKQDVMQLYSTPAITVDHTMEDDHSERNKKIFAAVATAVVFVVLVNTVGLFGIAALGLLAGGLIK